jgi:hypothetical protein
VLDALSDARYPDAWPQLVISASDATAAPMAAAARMFDVVGLPSLLARTMPPSGFDPTIYSPWEAAS